MIVQQKLKATIFETHILVVVEYTQVVTQRCCVSRKKMEIFQNVMLLCLPSEIQH